MDFYCPSCQEMVGHERVNCEAIKAWFSGLQGEKIWRLRYLNQYGYRFYSEQEYREKMEKEGQLILSDASSWEQFDPSSYSGINSARVRTSIFS